MNTIPPTALRVQQSTAQEINARIERETALNVQRIAAGGPAAIEQRLAELDREWDIERTLEANAAAVTLASLGLGFGVDKRWLLSRSLSLRSCFNMPSKVGASCFAGVASVPSGKSIWNALHCASCGATFRKQPTIPSTRSNLPGALEQHAPES